MLDALAKHLVDSKYDMRQLIRTITASREAHLVPVSKQANKGNAPFGLSVKDLDAALAHDMGLGQSKGVVVDAQPLDTGGPWWQNLLLGFGPTILFLGLIVAVLSPGPLRWPDIAAFLSLTAIIPVVQWPAMACVVVWRLARSAHPQARTARELLCRLSGRQLKRGREYTLPSMLAGLWVLLAMLRVLDDHSVEDLRSLAEVILGQPP